MSGWGVGSCFNFDDVKAPTEKGRMKKDSGADLINHLRTKLRDKWVPSMQFEPMAEVTSWKCPIEKRCQVCAIGYCRFNSSELKDSSDLICLTCTVRKELYTKCKGIFPTAFHTSTGKKLLCPFKSESSSIFIDDLEHEEAETQ